MKKNLSDNKGFSLVEVLVAIAILAICAAPFFHSFVLAMQTNETARQMLNATTVAENVMETVKAEGVKEFGTIIDGEYTNVTITQASGAQYTMSYPIYGAQYDHYLYDGKDYTVSVRMTPSQSLYQDETEDKFDEKRLIELYAMNSKTDAFYVQTPNDLWDKVQKYSIYKEESAKEIAQNIDTTYKFVIDKDNEFYTVNRQVTYQYMGEEIEVPDDKKIYDSIQTGGIIKNIYIFFIPSKTVNIQIENKNQVPVQIYLVKQTQDEMQASLSVNEKITKEKAVTQIRTNTDLSVGDLRKGDYSLIQYNGIEKSRSQAANVFGFDELNKKNISNVQLYDVEVTVKNTAGEKITSLTGTALK